MKRLFFNDGTRAALEGKDLASVARGLTDDDLAFWINRLTEIGTLYHELSILEAEATQRSSDWMFGPLFRMVTNG